MIPKHKYVRSKKLLRLVSELDCQMCGSGQMVQASHSNWLGGRGMGIKADDNLVAALCLNCHYQIDFGKNWSKEEKQRHWITAHRKTVESLLNLGWWPVDVPLPDDTQWGRFFC